MSWFDQLKVIWGPSANDNRFFSEEDIARTQEPSSSTRTIVQSVSMSVNEDGRITNTEPVTYKISLDEDGEIHMEVIDELPNMPNDDWPIEGNLVQDIRNQVSENVRAFVPVPELPPLPPLSNVKVDFNWKEEGF